MKLVRFTAFAVAILIMVLNPISAFAETSKAELPLKEKFSNGTGGKIEESESLPYYTDYALSNGSSKSGTDKIIISAEFNYSKTEEIEGVNAFYWNEDTEEIKYEIDIKDEGLYSLSLDYIFDGKTDNDGLRSFTVDGAKPFSDASNLTFFHLWKDNNDIKVNSIGDEVRPSSYEEICWQTMEFCDSQGLSGMPYEIFLSAGKHTIAIQYISCDFYIGNFSVYPIANLPYYDEYVSKYTVPSFEYDNTFQAEKNIVGKTSTTLTVDSDGNPSTVPKGVVSKKINVIGGWRWRSGNQKITWEFEVPDDGWYQIGNRYLQNWSDGMPSYRKLEIDGQVPFKEAKAYCFDYTQDWSLSLFKDAKTGKPYYFYLTGGKHTVSLSVTLEPIADLINSLFKDALLLSEIVVEITKLAGSEPDPNYDYEFFDRISGLKEKMSSLSSNMQEKYNFVKEMQNKLPAMANNFLSIKEQVDVMIENPFSIAKNVSDLTDAQTNLSTYYQDLQNSVLQIDFFRVSSAEKSWEDYHEAGFLEKLWATVLNFFISFSKDYDNMGSVLDSDVKVNKKINVWISRGTEWSEVINSLINEKFTPKTGIAVNINILPASQLSAGAANALMLSIAADRAPDVAMGVDCNSPVEFAFRDAVYDISRFEDYSEVEKRFLPGLMVPFKYNKGVYAIPETMNYSVMFYRKDILSSLGIDLPITWQQLYKTTLPSLYQNGYEFFYPSGGYTAFLYQNGGNYYSEDGFKSALNSSNALNAFKEYCELFTHYGVPVSANFFNRFRSGIMPLGIGDHSMYILLNATAPELAGNWGIAPIPGTEKGDGTVDRSNGGIASECDIILNQSSEKAAAWEFIKWWTGTETQKTFASEIEALIGIEARWNTANIEAFEGLNWKKEDLKVIESQWKWVREAPVVLGSYYTGRYIGNAWNNVVVSHMDARDALDDAVEEINKEMRLKQEEYHISAR